MLSWKYKNTYFCHVVLRWKKYLRPFICLSSTTDNTENPIKIFNTVLCLPLTLIVLVCDADCCWATMDNSIISDRQQTSWWWWWWLTGAETITRSREPNTADIYRYQGQCVGPAQPATSNYIDVVCDCVPIICRHLMSRPDSGPGNFLAAAINFIVVICQSAAQ